MCLSNVYSESDHELLMTNTSRLDVEDGVVRLRDLFGSVRVVSGSIVSSDFEKNEIIIRVNKTAV